MKIIYGILLILIGFTGNTQNFSKIIIRDFAEKIKPLIDNKNFVCSEEIRKSYHNSGRTENNKLKNYIQTEFKNEIKSDPVLLYKKLKKSTVIVGNAYYCNSGTDIQVLPSSGYIVSENGYFVSNNHVAKIAADNRNFSCFVYTSEGTVYPVEKIVARDSIHDIAIFKIKSDKSFIPVKFNLNPDLGSELFAIHHPKGIPYYFSKGLLTNEFYTNNKYSSSFCISAEFAEGSSGGPIFDDSGRLIATISGSKAIYMEDNNYYTDLQMVNYFCVPAKYLLSLFK